MADRPIRVLELRSALGAGGGPEKTILLGAALADRRHVDVTVCYLRDARDRGFSIAARAARAGVRYVEIVEGHSFDPRIWPALRRLVRMRRIDLVHTHEYKTDILGWSLSRVDGVAAIATVHGWIRNTARERLYTALDRRVLARFPLVIAVSQEIRRTLIAHGVEQARIRQLANGVDCRQFHRSGFPRAAVRARLGLPEDGRVIGSVGRLGAEKRYDLLVEAAALLEPRPIVVLAGDGPCRADLERLAIERGVELRLVGHRDDVREVYEAIDLFAQSSDTEGIPNVVLEAMAMQVPIVATAVGGTREIVSDEQHALIVPRRDPRALAAAMQRTFDDPPAAARRAARARARVEREFSFAARTAALEGLYEEVASARRSSGCISRLLQ